MVRWRDGKGTDTSDVRFGEDFCRIEDKNVQQNLNIARKIVLNTLRDYKNKTASKRPFSKLMLDCFA
jgi:hypothetical protein